MTGVQTCALPIYCLCDILNRQFFNTLGAQVCCVIGNHDHLRIFTEQFSIPFHHISHEGITPKEFETRILETLTPYNPDYLVLAKFMRILSPRFVKTYPERIINIQHSFLPAFRSEEHTSELQSLQHISYAV